MEELGVAYNLIPVNIGNNEQFKPEFLAISPNNKIPALVDKNGPDGKSLSIFESGAIVIYLAEKYGKLLGNNAAEKATILQWVFWYVIQFEKLLSD